MERRPNSARPRPDKPTRTPSVARASVIICAAVLAAVIAIELAEPIADGDIFFHLAYARQLLAHHTLIPDHTAFSWTPASNRMIYCAWASDLIFYALFRTFGLISMFVLRYAVDLGVVALAWSYARRTGRGYSPFTWLVLLIMTLASMAGAAIKPELFSFLLFNLLVWLYFRAKLYAREGRPTRILYWVPLLMAIWVNVHGAFALAAPFLAATAMGELANRRFSPGASLARPALTRLLVAWSLSALATLANPYGWRYPAQLFSDYVLSPTRPDIAWNNAHFSVFSSLGWSVYLPELMLIMAAILVVVLVRGGRPIDWAVLAANIVYIPFFIVYLRSTVFWPIVFAYTVWFLLPAPEKSNRAVFALAAAGLSVAVGAVSISQDVTKPGWGTWTGFGIGYLNPVVEAEYVAAHQLPPRLYNTFDSGAYLIWRLYPQYRVMVDSRSFPYLAWFQDQYDFTIGRTFDEFLRKYPGDAALISFSAPAVWRHFAESPEWRPVFYGPSAAIFLRRGERPDLRLVNADSNRFQSIHNGDSALRVFDFAVYVGDYRTAWSILDTVERKLSWQVDKSALAAARAYRNGHLALSKGEFAEALRQFDLVFRTRRRGPRDRLLTSLLVALSRAHGSDAKTIAAGINRLEASVW